MHQIYDSHIEMVAELCKPGAEILAELKEADAHLIHMIMGVCGEAGELLDAIKKAVIYRKELDLEHVIEEMGDIEFYLEGLRQDLRISRGQVLEQNIVKLRQRYSGGSYSNQAAKERADKAVTPNPVATNSSEYEEIKKDYPATASNVSDGSSADYYKLPAGATELQHLIAFKNMNAQIGEIFRECYRYGQASHSSIMRGIKKICFYAEAEKDRLAESESETEKTAATSTLYKIRHKVEAADDLIELLSLHFTTASTAVELCEEYKDRLITGATQ